MAFQRTFALAYLTYFSTKDGGLICTCGETDSCNDEMPEYFKNFDENEEQGKETFLVAV